ncbi:MAG: hypothetical protein Ct9H300mP9_4840 [Candidatus Neomarinimicrobiota bacterium]|nr:MAG: hypothetical protein Ct9H300mP9_4840 [Candidatus Neomarinimicrobiota bacterium]
MAEIIREFAESGLFKWWEVAVVLHLTILKRFTVL